MEEEINNIPLTRRMNKIMKQILGNHHNDDHTHSIDLHSQYVHGEQSDGVRILKKEREHAFFDVRELTFLLDGGESHTQLYELIFGTIEGDPVFNDEDSIFYMSLDQRRENTMRKIVKMFTSLIDAAPSGDNGAVNSQKKKSNDPMASIAQKFWEVFAIYDPSWATRIGVHFGLFQSAIESGGTEEQKAMYIPKARNMDLYGCFAMTELGHGSFIRGLETTATYDISTQEFIINSPTDTSTKWWIGGAGQTATHAVVFARLIINDVDYGVHNFVVQVRSLESGEAMPNISIGDCGPKMGRDGIDNGFIQFHHARIPRESMLMRWSQVSPDGEYTAPPKSQLSYGALLGGRVSMIRDSSKTMQRALTIVVRYSAIRRQFPSFDNPDEEESIMNYQTHQYRLMPMIATAFAFHFASTKVQERFENMLEDLNEGSLESLQVVHATSAGMKAISTWWCNESLEIARQCMGGNGYSTYSGIPTSLQDWAVNCTWEGDNTVLCQQTAKFLMTSFERKMNGGKLLGFIEYLSADILGSKSPIRTMDDILETDFIYEAHHWLSLYRVSETYNNIIETRKYETNEEIVTNENLQDLVDTAKTHCYFYVVDNFREVVGSIEDPQVRKAIKLNYQLFGLYKIEESLRFFLEGGFLSASQTKLISKTVRYLIKEVRKICVPLVDSFNFPDFLLRSPLGRYDGDIYPKYIEKVKSYPGNKNTLAPYYETLIKPAFNGTISL